MLQMLLLEEKINFPGFYEWRQVVKITPFSDQFCLLNLKLFSPLNFFTQSKVKLSTIH